MGFPPGVAEELVIKVLRTCDPKNWKAPNGAKKPTDVNNEIMCSTVAQEVEIVADDDDLDVENLSIEQSNTTEESKPTSQVEKTKENIVKEEKGKEKDIASTSIPSAPPIIPVQNSETYNGAERDNYSWSQTIMELGIE